MSGNLHDLSDMTDKIDPRLLMENFRKLASQVAKVRVQVVSAAPGVEFRVEHGLGLRPTGVFKVGSSAPVTIYDGDTEPDGRYLYLKADAGGVTITLDISGGEVTTQ